MADRQQLRLHFPGGFARGGTVELGGHRVEDEISSLDLHARAGEVITATLELFGTPVDLEAEVEVRLPESTQALLKRLGWTPPAEATS
jgi:hypothetical protein